MPIKATITAIVERFNNTPLKSAFPNGIWLDMLPTVSNANNVTIDIEENAPFLVVADSGATFEYSSEIGYTEQRRIGFAAFAIGADAAIAAGAMVRNVYGALDLVNKELHGVQWQKFELTGEQTTMHDLPSKSGKRVYYQQLDFMVWRGGSTADWTN